jgi:hypothetical protein
VKTLRPRGVLESSDDLETVVGEDFRKPPRRKANK